MFRMFRKMFRKMICFVSLVLVLGLVSDVQAEWHSWTNADPGDQLWSTPGNWGSGTVPVAGDSTNLYEALGPIVDPSVNLALDGGASGGGLTMDGGTLGYNWFNLGTSAGATGTLNMNSGALSVSGDFGVGSYGTGIITMTGGTISANYMPLGAWGAGAEGYLDMTGGTVNADYFFIGAWADNTVGHVGLHGGTIDIGYLYMGVGSGSVGTMDITDGTLISDNDLTGDIQGFIDNGWITGYGGAGEAIVSYDGETTTLYAVPEPATMCLLGLGGLLLRRRRSA